MNEAASELLADANETVREQLALAWREHIERVRESLESQWPERLERVIEETVAGLAARLDEEHRDALEARTKEAHRSAEIARRELIQRLNQVTRRLRHFENERQWSNALVDGTRGFCGRAAVFLIRDGKLHLETTRNFDDADLGHEVPLDAAPAFRTALETRDTLVVIRSASELSEPVAWYLGEVSGDDDGRGYLFPVLAGQDVPAILYADSNPVDVDALDLLVSLAGAVSQSHQVKPPEIEAPQPVLAEQFPASNGLVTITTAPTSATQKPEILSWFSLSREDRDLHLRAQRYARVQVAEIRLYQSERVKNGRAAHDLYTSLKTEVDSAREAFRREFWNTTDSMVDYLHLELVRTLANDDAEVLGGAYPGPLV